MDLSLSEPEQDLVDLCRDFAQQQIALRAPLAWEEARCPTDLLREMGELGLLGMLIPEEWGGIGMSTTGFVAAMEQIGLADQSVAAAWQAHVTIGSLPLYLFGDDAQRERWLRPLAEGRVLGAFGLTEPDAGSDARGIRTRAERQDGGWLINGRKTFISNAGTDMSFGVTLLARVQPTAGDGPGSGASWSRRVPPVSPWVRRCGVSVGAASTPASSISTTSSSPTTSSSATRTWDSASSCRPSRSDASRSPRCRSASPRPSSTWPPPMRVSGCSSGSPSPSSRPCSSSWPTSPPSSKRPGGSPIGPPTSGTGVSRSSRRRPWPS